MGKPGDRLHLLRVVPALQAASLRSPHLTGAESSL